MPLLCSIQILSSTIVAPENDKTRLIAYVEYECVEFRARCERQRHFLESKHVRFFERFDWRLGGLARTRSERQ
jgi:hypothetical protein